jgi:LacI family transcriptional regulator, galactose operon repressor
MVGDSRESAAVDVPKPKPTIYDVARIAGVSANTVSRVINGKSGVSESTRARIRAIIDDVGYHPHMGARSLRGGRQGCIGLTVSAPVEVVPLTQSIFLWLFGELHRAFGSKGERICFDTNPHKASRNGDYARSVWDKLFSVCVIGGPLAVDDTTIERIHESGIPYLAMGRLDRFPACSCATVDYEQGALLSTRFLLDRGHKRVAMLKALSGFQPGVERSRGYRRALDEANVEFDERLVQSVTFGASNIATTVHRLLMDHQVTALVDCSGTEDAWAIREGARRAGRVPGKDFDVVCWTYANNAAVMREACAHVWLPVKEAMSEGIDLLAEWHWGRRKGPIHVVYAPTLMETVAGEEAGRPSRLFETLE